VEFGRNKVSEERAFWGCGLTRVFSRCVNVELVVRVLDRVARCRMWDDSV
jgi:hypothetical protein